MPKQNTQNSHHKDKCPILSANEMQCCLRFYQQDIIQLSPNLFINDDADEIWEPAMDDKGAVDYPTTGERQCEYMNKEEQNVTAIDQNTKCQIECC